MNVSWSHRAIRPSAPLSTLRRGRRGSLLMEAVLCLPLLLALVSGIAQFARVWEARLFTWLAAYNAARATLVYNERDYSEVRTVEETIEIPNPEGGVTTSVTEEQRQLFHERKGIAWLAAVNTLAWMSATEDADSLLFPTMGRVPNSTRIREQVEIVSRRPTADSRDFRFSEEGPGYVRVCVAFQFPLFFSIFDPTLFGRTPASTDASAMPATFTNVEPDNALARKEGRLGRTITLRETVLLSKPWSTQHHPLLSRAERLHLLEAGAPADSPHWWDNE